MSTSKIEEVTDPFGDYLEEAAKDSIFIDLTDKLETKGKDTVKVRLTQLTDAVTIKKKHGPPDLEVYQSMVTSESRIEGVLAVESLPLDNVTFKLNYHMFDGLLEFGLLESSAPLKHVIIKDNYYYFKDSEGMWRLEVVTDYN